MKSNFKFVKTEPPTEAYVKTYCPHSTMDEQMILWLEREMLNYAHNYKDENGVARAGLHEYATEIFNAIKGDA